MWTAISKQNKFLSHYRVILALFLVLPLITPLPAFAEDTSSIDTLRQMGKAFAEIAEKASPAVVGIKADQVVTQEYSTIPDWPFTEPFDPFGDDFTSPPLTSEEISISPTGPGLRFYYLPRWLYPYKQSRGRGRRQSHGKARGRPRVYR
jgi:hypothetical protein